ncbi:NADP-dependent oxidoreductase domain-containing protein [Aspergillus alliaceus]|uniref:pyridoxine 4-dehydrogenase n=2 Tax=Petromyces alliaceus TaxID=209559 RepID=A0A5N7CKD1_PETAA|nr:NADP-dependent oxidoreductase domain-containing protein [Aspergillus alliaceus]KAB8238846.1 NADP-dependent oxidoreductase domain-containing protein [Aspergillus alliaceus]KAE8394329.1 NADP-dependent oxidoreductase domain-containing protein [Aspergillus alliaceus]
MPSLVGRDVGHTGYGLMRMTWVPQPPPQEQCFEALNTALAAGSNFWNAGELYGTPEYNSLHLLSQYFARYPENAEKVVLSIKGGLKRGELTPDGSEANIRRSVDECLRLLGGRKKIDIFECARQDPTTTVEQTVGVLARLVEEGKIGAIGLSEVDAETIRRAHKVHPIAAVEVELSLFDITILQNDVAKVCAELNIPIVAYSPLGRGVLAGAFTKAADIPEGDFRRTLPKFQDDAMKQNIKLVNEVNDLASRKGVAPVQIAIAWVLTLSDRPDMPTIIPIPGGTTSAKVTQNLQSPRLTDAEMAEIDAILKQNEVFGARY